MHDTVRYAYMTSGKASVYKYKGRRKTARERKRDGLTSILYIVDGCYGYTRYSGRGSG